MEKSEVDELRELTKRVCENVTAYIGAQLDGSFESMQMMASVIDNINIKYMGMKQEIKSIGKLSNVLEARAHAVKEKMNMIDEIDKEISEIEDMVNDIEQYTTSLEMKFNQVR
ncbi:unnamed protein product [Peronospora belbahrii]|uniref:Biogenesis of lysosome-related organelles complex 1 subunit 2 n=1 Tax=Peronospora belbahrii TaxID=622444 RepID=A0AAU9KR43_9STRA|nr:unnamed protein product [Peronospora belbahrii]CAH0519910.1 unnamed protein product [Peronospora belbahrii]